MKSLHAPSRAVQGPGTIWSPPGPTAAPIFRAHEEFEFLELTLLNLAQELDWKLEAWAVFPNHYHFIGRPPTEQSPPRRFTNRLHGATARWINQRHDQAGRKVWFSYWQTALTYEKSYLARLNYVTQNPVHHKLPPSPTNTPTATPSGSASSPTPPGTKP